MDAVIAKEDAELAGIMAIIGLKKQPRDKSRSSPEFLSFLACEKRNRQSSGLTPRGASPQRC
jgi:hypothetical protein